MSNENDKLVCNSVGTVPDFCKNCTFSVPKTRAQDERMIENQYCCFLNLNARLVITNKTYSDAQPNRANNNSV